MREPAHDDDCERYTHETHNRDGDCDYRSPNRVHVRCRPALRFVGLVDVRTDVGWALCCALLAHLLLNVRLTFDDVRVCLTNAVLMFDQTEIRSTKTFFQGKWLQQTKSIWSVVWALGRDYSGGCSAPSRRSINTRSPHDRCPNPPTSASASLSSNLEHSPASSCFCLVSQRVWVQLRQSRGSLRPSGSLSLTQSRPSSLSDFGLRVGVSIVGSRLSLLVRAQVRSLIRISWPTPGRRPDAPENDKSVTIRRCEAAVLPLPVLCCQLLGGKEENGDHPARIPNGIRAG